MCLHLYPRLLIPPIIMPALEQELTGASGHSGQFQTTHWSTVITAGPNDSEAASAAMARLCQTYWQPLFLYIRRLGHGPEDAQDLTQEFFARLLAKDYLKAVDRAKGKFRSFLLTAVKRFLANEWDRANRQKRGGGMEVLSLESEDFGGRHPGGLVDDRTPDKVFEQRWAAVLLEQVFTRLAVEMAADGKENLFQELRGFLTGGTDGNSYPEMARRLEMSEGTVRVNVHRLRQRYRQLLRLEIAHTVDSPEGIDDEIRCLFAALG
jgi:RNA polymerase sigma factor (sigma-70 family)